MNLKHIIAEYLRDSADKLDEDECALSESELQYLLSLIAHRELNKTEAAELLNMSTRTFDRKILAGEIPTGLHKRGSNSLIWYRDEIENLKN